MSQPEIPRGPSPARVLVVVAMWGLGAILLGGLLVVSVWKVNECQAAAQTQRNLHTIAKAAHAFAGDHKRFPPGTGEVHSQTGTVLSFLIPYVESIDLHDQDRAGEQRAVFPLYVAPIDYTAPDGMTST